MKDDDYIIKSENDQLKHWQKPIVRHIVDTVMDCHYTDIIFPGWNQCEGLACSYRFRTHDKGINYNIAKAMAKVLHCKLEIEEGDHLEIFDYSEDQA